MTEALLSLKKDQEEKRNIVLFLCGKAVSMFGSSVYGFAIGLYVLTITGSALSYAVTIMMNVVPMILINPIAGVLADRFPKKMMIVGTDLLNGALFFLLFYMSHNQPLSLGHIYASSFLLSVVTSFYGITMEAAKPGLTYPKRRIRVNSLSKLIDSLSTILGPILGGVMIALMDIRVFMLLNGISFVLSAISEFFIDYEFYVEPQQKRVVHKMVFIEHLKMGISYIFDSKVLKKMFFMFIALNFLLGFSLNVPLPYIVNEILLLPPKLYGIINAMISIGLILGALTVEKLTRRMNFSTILPYTVTAISVLVSLLGIPVFFQEAMNTFGHTIYFSSLCLLVGIGISYVDIPVITIMQNEIPPDIRGVVFGVSMSVVKLVLPMALLVSGYLVKYVPIIILPMIGAIITLGINFILNRKD